MDRRPLKSRDRGWARALASLLVRWRIRPNAISIFSIVFALGAGAALIASRNAEGMPRVGLLIAAAAGIQLRLLCNLFDGMVAVEGKMASKTGDIFNELPDRIADPLIIVPVGYAIIRFYSLAPALGLWAGPLAGVAAAWRGAGPAGGDDGVRAGSRRLRACEAGLRRPYGETAPDGHAHHRHHRRC